MKKLNFFRGIGFRQSMFLIYIIGGMIPFIWSSLYTNQKNRANMVELNKETQAEELSLIRAQIDESMTVVEDVGRQLYKNKTIRKIVTKKYKDIDSFEQDCSKLGVIDKYLSYYKQDIAAITIYVNNKPVNTNKYFSYLGESATSQDWYEATLALEGGAYWGYGYDKTLKEKYLQVTRELKDDKGNMIGILAVQMQNSRVSEMISGCSVDTVLLYNDKDVIYTNYQIIDDTNILFELLKLKDGEKFSGIMSQGVEEYLLAYSRMYQGVGDTHYTLASIQNYPDVMSNINRNSLQGYIAVIVGLVLSVSLIAVFSYMYGRRMDLLRQQMHLVAIGEYDKVQKVEGNDEIAEIYRELEKMKEDNQKLMRKVVDEQVQKEKLHTKQKEVEFKMLASQINPHFLYNTLETIRMKARVNDEPEIEELVKMLAKIMRRNIQVSDQQVTLKSEIELIRYYLKIQSYRFSDRIESNVIIADDIDMTAKVLPLIIQPFVENAFVHGLEQRESGGVLNVKVEREREVIKITVEDNGVGMSYYKLGKLRHIMNGKDNSEGDHIGVNNVNQRIKLQYGDSYGVKIDSTEGVGTTVIISMPYYWGDM